MLYPLAFEAQWKDRLWGGENWLLSGVPGEESVVADGPLAGCSIARLVETYKGALLGEAVYTASGGAFPLLFKEIDAREDLSVQVHPDDALAAARHGCRGKTEMWYVTEAEAGAQLYTGLARPLTPEEYEARVADGSIMDVLARYEVHPGDVFFLPAGRIHAIGGGCRIAEIQQASDITYRIWDYGRKGPDGKTRELHTGLAKAAVDYRVYPEYRTLYTPVRDEEQALLRCSCFSVFRYELTLPYAKDLSELDSFLTLMCVSGGGTLLSDGFERPVRAGETLLVPASADDLCLIPDGGGMTLLGTCIA